ncbi:hypothetical protein D3C75_1264480 [compost metagenome]
MGSGNEWWEARKGGWEERGDKREKPMGRKGYGVWWMRRGEPRAVTELSGA